MAESRQKLRVIGGSLRGRKIEFEALSGLRPTSDRIRETLFNWLMKEIAGASVLDGFSGSGALGIEALSRGAKKVSFVEKSPIAARLIEKHLKAFEVNLVSYEVCSSDFLQFLKAQSKAFDLIFLDPPFMDSQVKEYLAAAKNVLSKTGKIYLEQPKSVDFTKFEGFSVLKMQTAGEVRFGLLIPEALNAET